MKKGVVLFVGLFLVILILFILFRVVYITPELKKSSNCTYEGYNNSNLTNCTDNTVKSPKNSEENIFCERTFPRYLRFETDVLISPASMNLEPIDHKEKISTYYYEDSEKIFYAHLVDGTDYTYTTISKSDSLGNVTRCSLDYNKLLGEYTVVSKGHSKWELNYPYGSDFDISSFSWGMGGLFDGFQRSLDSEGKPKGHKILNQRGIMLEKVDNLFGYNNCYSIEGYGENSKGICLSKDYCFQIGYGTFELSKEFFTPQILNIKVIGEEPFDLSLLEDKLSECLRVYEENKDTGIRY